MPRFVLSARSFFVLGAAFALAACGGSTADPTNAPIDGGNGDTGGVVTDSGPGSPDTPPTSGLSFKTYVTLGDSISDKGGEGPFFYDLLVKNDDTKYPEAKGKDLSTKYGADIVVQHASKGGARSVNLDSQVGGLPKTLAGPVLVTITIGGNDIQAALANLLATGDDSKDRATFQANLKTALDELTQADRFGAGVKVRVVLANVYDPSDGTGNFTYGSSKCPGALGFWPSGKATSTLLDPWEKIMADEAAKHPEVTLVDLRAKFNGHGVATGAATTWFYSDCIHPNAAGHASTRDLFWGAIDKL